MFPSLRKVLLFRKMSGGIFVKFPTGKRSRMANWPAGLEIPKPRAQLGWRMEQTQFPSSFRVIASLEAMGSSRDMAAVFPSRRNYWLLKDGNYVFRLAVCEKGMVCISARGS